MDNILIDDVPFQPQSSLGELFTVFQTDEPAEDEEPIVVFDSILKDYDEEEDHFGQKLRRPYGFVDLDEMQLFGPQEGLTRYAETIDDGDMDEDLHKSEGHPIIRADRPLGPFHFLIALHPTGSLPQVLGPEIIEELTAIIDVFESDSLLVGFNSLNAGAYCNKLHVECILPEHIAGFQRITLQRFQPTVVFESSSLTAQADGIEVSPVSAGAARSPGVCACRVSALHQS